MKTAMLIASVAVFVFSCVLAFCLAVFARPLCPPAPGIPRDHTCPRCGTVFPVDGLVTYVCPSCWKPGVVDELWREDRARYRRGIALGLFCVAGSALVVYLVKGGAA